MSEYLKQVYSASYALTYCGVVEEADCRLYEWSGGAVLYKRAAKTVAEVVAEGEALKEKLMPANMESEMAFADLPLLVQEALVSQVEGFAEMAEKLFAGQTGHLAEPYTRELALKNILAERVIPRLGSLKVLPSSPKEGEHLDVKLFAFHQESADDEPYVLIHRTVKGSGDDVYNDFKVCPCPIAIMEAVTGEKIETARTRLLKAL